MDPSPRKSVLKPLHPDYQPSFQPPDITSRNRCSSSVGDSHIQRPTQPNASIRWGVFYLPNYVGLEHKCYYETDELPNPRPTQPKENEVKSSVWATFFAQQIIFRGLGLISCRKQTTRNPTQPNQILETFRKVRNRRPNRQKNLRKL